MADDPRSGPARDAESAGDRATRAVLFGLLVLVGIVVWMRRADEAPSPPPPRAGATPTPAPDRPGPPPGLQAEPGDAAHHLVVEIAGLVERPGVYRLPPGSTFGALMAQAGASTPGGRPLPEAWAARPLAQGERLTLSWNEMPQLTAGQMDASKRLLFGMKLDLNRASAEDLALLPGIGPETARAIVAERERRGGFGSVDALLDVKGIGPKTLEGVRDTLEIGPTGEAPP